MHTKQFLFVKSLNVWQSYWDTSVLVHSSLLFARTCQIVWKPTGQGAKEWLFSILLFFVYWLVVMQRMNLVVVKSFTICLSVPNDALTTERYY